MPEDPLKYDVRSIPGGRSGTVATLRAMRKLAQAGMAHPRVIENAHRIVKRVPERDDVATMEAMLADVRGRMRYTRDPLGVELVKAPWIVLDRTEATAEPEPMDCDDAATYLSAHLGAVGIPSRYVVVRTDPARPRDFSHVYLKAMTSEGKWIALDPIVRKWGVGREVPTSGLMGRREYLDVGGLGAVGCENGRRCQVTEDEDGDSLFPTNRLNGINGAPGVGGLGGTDLNDVIKVAKDAVEKYVAAKYGKKPKTIAPTQAPPTVPAAAAGGRFNLAEWFLPVVPTSMGLQFNPKGLIGAGAVAFGIYMLVKRNRKRRK